MDEENFIYIVDRKKDIIIRGGENISCAEVEAAFYTHTAVRECSAFAIPHERFGECVGLMVSLKDGQTVTAKTLLNHVKGNLAGFKIPEESAIFLTNEPLPKGATMKIDKKLIRETVTRKLATQGKSKW